MNSKGIIDRFEGNYAIIEIENYFVDFPRFMLPDDAREGSVVKFTLEIDKGDEAERKSRIEVKLNKLKNRDNNPSD